ncbi:hypothetical protein RB597_008948 [Gaeumannomyces tritici]
MMRSHTLPLLASVATGLVIPSPPTEMTQPVTVHFVPGAFHGPWAFDLIRAELASRGFNNTSASTLPSTLVDAGQKVVLVVHSYGGAVSSNVVEGLSVQQRAAAGKPGGIITHVFLTAMALSVGQSALGVFNGTLPPWLEVTDDGKFYFPSTPEQIFYNDVEDQELVAKCVAALRPEPFKIVQDASRYAPWTEDNFNVAYIHTELDQAIDISVQNSLSSQFPAGSFMATMNAGHSPFLSQPKELADNIIAAHQHLLSN